MADPPLTPEEVRQLLAELHLAVERSRPLMKESERINKRADEITRRLAQVLQESTKK
jgi:hypothetical protein